MAECGTMKARRLLIIASCLHVLTCIGAALGDGGMFFPWDPRGRADVFQPTQKGGLKDGGIDPEKMQDAIRMFYGVMGWDEQTGVPTASKLGELKIGWAADSIPA